MAKRLPIGTAAAKVRAYCGLMQDDPAHYLGVMPEAVLPGGRRIASGQRCGSDCCR
jgi:hypothetical protein